jgi:hypothetical protein
MMLNNSSEDEAGELDRQQQAQEEEDDDDFAPLMLSSNDSHDTANEDETVRDYYDDDEDDDDGKNNSRNAVKNKLATAPALGRKLPCSGLFMIMSTTMLLLFAVIFITRKNDFTGTSKRTNETSLKTRQPSSSVLPQYSCPGKSPNSNMQEEEKPEFNADEPQLYVGQDAMILDNITAYVEQYRESDFDQWGNTYNDFKQNRSDFITRRFGPYLQSGSSLYESACGIGLNLALTVEVLCEALGISDLVVYGNDFVPDSIVVANALLAPERGGILSPANGRVGKLCHGDSMDLSSHVPSNAFDLVFTGYVTPLQDPLNLNLDSSSETQRYYSHIICKSDGDHHKQQHSAAAMQEKQEAWFGAWVGEMVRIAKPGVPVIIEGVSHSLCVAPNDWGGVEVEFWYSAAEKYGWDVDVESIEMEPDFMDMSRYHVFMRKSSIDAEP